MEYQTMQEAEDALRVANLIYWAVYYEYLHNLFNLDRPVSGRGGIVRPDDARNRYAAPEDIRRRGAARDGV